MFRYPRAVCEFVRSRSPRARSAAIFLAALIGGALAPAPRPAGAADSSPAVDQFQRLQRNLADDKKRSDWAAFLDEAQQLEIFLKGSPASVLELARAQLLVGDRAAALRETQRFLAMGQINPILDSPLFEPLRSAIASRISRNRQPISAATAAFEISDPELLPEDIDYDPASKRFFVSSILEHRVVGLDESGHPVAFAVSPSNWPMVALKVDAQRRRLWATEVALDGFTSVSAADRGRSALLEYDLDRGTLLARYDGPPHADLGDMALAADGDPIVSDGAGGGVYRLRDGAFVRIDRGDFISPQTPAICGDDRHVFIPDYVRGIARLDLQSGAARWLSTQDRFALSGVDGLYCRGRSLIAVQNGAAPERVTAFSLNAARTEILAEKAVERATRTLGEPTHGVFVGSSFFYIANSGWDALDAHGAIRPASHLTPAVLMRIDRSALGVSD